MNTLKTKPEYEIEIPAGTKVLGREGLVELVSAVYVRAQREDDGPFYYRIGKRKYYVPGGCCRILFKYQSLTDEP